MARDKKTALLLSFFTFSLVAVVFIVHQFIPLNFLFKATYENHKGWYPHLFPITFLFSKALFPGFYGVCLYIILKYWYKTSLTRVVIFLAIQTLLVITLLELFVFEWCLAYGLILVLFNFLPFLKHFNTDKSWNAHITRGLAGGFLFVLYIGLCLSLPRFHPFAKYTMFNRFPESTYAFLLRNEENTVIPLEEYNSMNGDNLYTTYESICEINGFAYGDASQNPEEQKIAYDKLMQIVFTKWKKILPFDSVFLYRVEFEIKNDKHIVRESRVAQKRVAR
jgi:hypothetical protein